MRIFKNFLIFLLFSLTITVPCYCYAEEVNLTEEQKQELLNSLKPKLEKMKSDLEKINQMQQQNQQPQQPVYRGRTINTDENTDKNGSAIGEPEWDGVYIKTVQDSYIELKPVTKGNIQKANKLFSREKYFSIVLYKPDINYISPEVIKGFYFKGKGSSGKIEINRIEKVYNPLTQILSSNAQDFRMEEYDKNNNLFTQMRVRSTQDSLYAEPRDPDFARQYLKKDDCFVIYVEKGSQNLYAVCPDQ